VGIGASAGGLKVLQNLFATMPATSGLAFVVVQHLSPGHESHMAEILGRHTTMKVGEAADGMALEPDVVYTAPPGVFVALRKGRFRMSRPAADHEVRMPIDFFLGSLARDQGAGAVGIILSGTGTDGTYGLRAVRGAGGLALVQEPGTAEFDAMPRSAIATGLADRVLPVEAMARVLLAFAGRTRDETLSEEDEALIGQILDLLNQRTGNDYRRYKKGTVGRRILRRMDLHQIASLPDYLDFLAGHPDEVAHLSKDMLIGVTSFFRDPEAFQVLRETVIGPLAAANGRTIRVWVPGCATGEEAYSLAIALKEELAARAIAGCTVQIFASDIDEGALAIGRAGIYPASIAGDVSPERLARFFVQKDGVWQVSKELRDSVIFSLHNLLADPPFAKLDLVSCRNLLIYIEPDMQSKILALFAFTLNPGAGYLFLGKSETIGKAGDWFESVNEPWRVFRRNLTRVQAGDFPLGSGRLRGLANGRALPARPRPVNLGDVVRRAVIEAAAVGVALVDARGRVLYLDGPINRFLDLPAGEPTLNIFAMVRKRTATALRAAVRKATETGESSILKKVRLKDRDGMVVANLAVRPTGEPGPDHENLAAILFEEVRAAERALPGDKRGALEVREAPLVEQLEAEIGTLQNELRATAEDHESSTEEFKSANEEVMAMNEELQSANEELESSREELQSVNEELGTVNTQLNDRLRELTAANNDLSNLMAATAIATVFLDRELRIRSFTPSATELLHLIPADVGRPIGDIGHALAGEDITSAAGKVLQSLSPVEHEVRAKNGGWHLMRVRPYRTLDDKIDGVVITLTDVSVLKLREQEALSARAYAESIVDTVHEPLVVLDRGFRVVSANRAFYTAFRTGRAEAEGHYFLGLGGGQWSIPGLSEMIEGVFNDGAAVDGFAIEHEFPGLGFRAMVLNARAVAWAPGHPPLVLLAIEDVTERKRTEETMRESEAQYRGLFENMSEGVAYCRMIFDNDKPRDFVYLAVNDAFESLTGLKDVVGKKVTEVIPGIRETDPQLFEAYGRASLTGSSEKLEIFIRALEMWFSVSVFSAERGCFVAVFDVITERKRSEENRRLTAEALQLLNDPGETSSQVDGLLKLIRQWAGCDAIGLRLKCGEDFPYYHQLGFSEEFARTENFLCARDPHGAVAQDAAGQPVVECTCGLVLTGRTDPSKPFFTAGGSFWTNEASKLLELKAEEDPRTNPRNYCITSGYESVALIPLKAGGGVIGLLQINDRRKGRFSPETVSFLEDLSHSIGIALDRRQAAERLLESEMRLRMAQDAAKAGTWEWDLRTDENFWSPELWKLYGLEPHKTTPSYRTWLQLVHPDDRERVNHAMKETVQAGAELVIEWRACDHDGAERWLMLRGQPVRDARNRVMRYIGIVMDITERKWMEAELKRASDGLERKVLERTAELKVKSDQLLHSQKLEALGKLAGGVAHDFNNLMTVVTGYGQRLLRDDGLSAAQRSALEQINKAGEGAVNLTRQLLAFSRKQVTEPVVLDVSELVDSMRKMLPPVLGEDIAVFFELSPAPWPVKADPTQISQVIMNLAVNSRDAMPTGGDLTIRTANVQAPATDGEAHEDLPPGRYVLLSVSDNGTGMSAEAQEHIFEPFFTTKSYGEGTGLGLSSVYGIVQQSGGHIRMDTQLGRGTTFSLYFPASDEEPGKRAAPRIPGAEEAPTLRGSETILLLEDDPAVCDLLTTELRELGYRVLPCKTAGDAIRQAEALKVPVDLLLSDVVLPGISGPTMAKMFKDRCLVKRVLFMSGHTEKHIVNHGVLIKGVAFIGKPFTTEALARKVRETLDGHS